MTAFIVGPRRTGRGDFRAARLLMNAGEADIAGDLFASLARDLGLGQRPLVTRQLGRDMAACLVELALKILDLASSDRSVTVNAFSASRSILPSRYAFNSAGVDYPHSSCGYPLR